MREVFIDQDSVRVGLFKSVLDDAGIVSFIRNQYGNSITEMPTPLMFPTLCVLDDDDYEEAMRILGGIYYGNPASLPDQKCPRCGAEVPGNFDSCWQCGSTFP